MITVPRVVAEIMLPIFPSAKPSSFRYRLKRSMNPEKPIPQKKVATRNNRAFLENKRRLLM